MRRKSKAEFSPDNEASARDFRKPGWPKGMRQRGDSFYFERDLNGVRHKFRLPFTEATAVKQASLANDLLADGKSIEHLKQGQRVSIAKLMEQVEADAAEKQPATQKSLRARLRIFAKFLETQQPGAVLLASITPDVARRFVEWRRSTPVPRNGSPKAKSRRVVPSQATINEDLRILRGCFDRAVELKWIPTNPFGDVKAPKLPKRVFEAYRLSEEEITQLLLAAEKYDDATPRRGAQSTFKGIMHDMTRLFLLTGLRSKEMQYLAWEQVDLDWGGASGKCGLLRIEPYELNGHIRIPLTVEQMVRVQELIARRGNREHLFENEDELTDCVPAKYIQTEAKRLLRLRPRPRVLEDQRLIVPKVFRFRPKATSGNVPLIPESRAILEARHQTSEGSLFVFPHPDGGRLRSDYWAQFKAVLKEAGLPDRVRVHDLRHTFGMRLRDRRIPLETIMGLMRHKNITETRLYAPYRDEEGAESIQLLSGVGTGARPPTPRR